MCLALLLGLDLVAQAIAAAPGERWLPVAAGVWRLPALDGAPSAANGGRSAQLLLVREGRRVWLIGSGPTPAQGALLAREARRLGGHPVSDIVNTRPAPELAMGNAAFPAARLWALPEVIEAMRARCPACLQWLRTQLGAAGGSLDPARIRVPTRAVEGVALGPFDWRAFERAPGEPVLVLRHRRSGLLIVQGLLWPGAVPDLRETRSDRLLASLQSLCDWAGEGALLGEQGGPATAAALRAHIDYLQALRQAVLLRLERGDAAGAPLELPAFAALPGYRERHPLNVQRVWRELEPTLFP